MESPVLEHIDKILAPDPGKKGGKLTTTNALILAVLKNGVETGTPTTTETLFEQYPGIAETKDALRDQISTLGTSLRRGPRQFTIIHTPKDEWIPRMKTNEENGINSKTLEQIPFPPNKETQTEEEKKTLIELLQIFSNLLRRSGSIKQKALYEIAIKAIEANGLFSDKHVQAHYHESYQDNEKWPIQICKTDLKRLSKTISTDYFKIEQTQDGTYKTVLLKSPEECKGLIAEHKQKQLSVNKSEKLTARVTKNMRHIETLTSPKNRPALNVAITEVLLPYSIQNTPLLIEEITEKTNQLLDKRQSPDKRLTKSILRTAIDKIEDINQKHPTLIGYNVERVTLDGKPTKRIKLKPTNKKYEPSNPAVSYSRKVPLHDTVTENPFSCNKAYVLSELEKWACTAARKDSDRYRFMVALLEASATGKETTTKAIGNKIGITNYKKLSELLARTKETIENTTENINLVITGTTQKRFYMETPEITIFSRKEDLPYETPENNPEYYSSLTQRIRTAIGHHLSSFNERSIIFIFHEIMIREQRNEAFSTEEIFQSERNPGVSIKMIRYFIKKVQELNEADPTLLGFDFEKVGKPYLKIRLMKAKANRPAKPATKATDPAETMSPKLKEILSRATTTARIDKLLAQINAANTEQDTNETNLQMREEQTVFMPSLIDQTLLLQQQVQKILAQEAKTREIFDPYQQKFEDFSSICTETQERISDIEKANPDFSQQTEATLAKAEALAPKPSEEELADASAQALEGLKGVEYPSKPLRRNKPIKPPKGIVPTARNINTDPALREYAGSIDLGQNWLKEMSDD
jgi:hypothetical protein